MKHQKKGFRIIIASFLSIVMLSNTPMWMTTVESKKPHQKKHQHARQDDTDVVDDQSNSGSDADDTNSNDDQHASSTSGNKDDERREKKWERYLRELDLNEVKHFKDFPDIVLKTFREKKVEVKRAGRFTSLVDKILDKAPAYIKVKSGSAGADVIVTKDHRLFSEKDFYKFLEAISEFTVEKQAEAGTLVTLELLDALNEMKEKKGRIGQQGQALLFTQPFKDHKGLFDIKFLQDHLSGVKEMVKQSIIWFADPTQRILLDDYAEPMSRYLQKDAIDFKDAEFTFVKDAADLGGSSEKYIMRDQNGDQWLFKVAGRPGAKINWKAEAEVSANKLLKALGLPSVEIGSITFDIPGEGERFGSIQRMIALKTWEIGEASELTDVQRKQMQEQQIIDYLIANLDSHKDNFGIDHKGNIVGFDKGNALLFYGYVSDYKNRISNQDPILSFEYDTPYYSDMWNGWLEGKYEMDPKVVEPLIEEIKSISDADLENMFKVYAERREKQTGESAEELLKNLVERKNTIDSKFKDFYEELARKKKSSLEGSSTPAVKPDKDRERNGGEKSDDRKEQDDEDKPSKKEDKTSVEKQGDIR